MTPLGPHDEIPMLTGSSNAQGTAPEGGFIMSAAGFDALWAKLDAELDDALHRFGLDLGPMVDIPVLFLDPNSGTVGSHPIGVASPEGDVGAGGHQSPSPERL